MRALPVADLPDCSQLLGLGAAQPVREISAEELGAPFGKSADWIRTRTGIQQLRRLTDAAELTGLATSAGRDALAAAQLAPDHVDLVITASCSSTDELPRAVRLITPRAGWLQINAACSGFSYALQTADDLIRGGAATHILILAAEHMSRLLDPADLATAIIFGDGAGAAVLGPGTTGHVGVGPTVTGSDGRHAELITVTDGRLRMAGPEVFRWAVERLPALAREACRRAGVTLAEIDVFVPHQANLRIIDAAVRALRLDHAVIADDIANSGNTSAASIPIALTRLLDAGRAKAGQLALLAGFGAGPSYAAQVVALP